MIIDLDGFNEIFAIAMITDPKEEHLTGEEFEGLIEALKRNRRFELNSKLEAHIKKLWRQKQKSKWKTFEGPSKKEYESKNRRRKMDSGRMVSNAGRRDGRRNSGRSR